METGEEFARFKEALWQDLLPVGALEELLVEKIAIECWRLQRAIKYETEEMRRGSAFVNIPNGVPMDKILRYQTTIKRQLFQAMNQLERLQRARKGDVVPAPINVEVSGDR